MTTLMKLSKLFAAVRVLHIRKSYTAFRNTMRDLKKA